MSEKLLPCPFCGSAFKMGREPNDNHPVAGQFYLYHDYGPLGSLARLCPISINQHFYTDAEALTAWNTRAAMQADAAPVAWLKTWNSVGNARTNMQRVDLTPDCEDWLASMLPTITPLYAHPPVDDRVSTSSPVDDRAAPETSVKLRDAMEVYQQAYVTWVSNEHENNAAAYKAAATIIEQDREAVRAEQAAEIERLKKLIEATSAHFLRLNADHPIMWEGAIDAAMEAVCQEVERQAAELAKIKALAETLADKIWLFHSMLDHPDYDFGEAVEEFLSAVEPALRQYKEARDAP